MYVRFCALTHRIQKVDTSLSNGSFELLGVPLVGLQSETKIKFSQTENSKSKGEILNRFSGARQCFPTVTAMF